MPTPFAEGGIVLVSISTFLGGFRQAVGGGKLTAPRSSLLYITPCGAAAEEGEEALAVAVVVVLVVVVLLLVVVDPGGVSPGATVRVAVVDSGCRRNCSRRLEARFTVCFWSGIASDS